MALRPLPSPPTDPIVNQEGQLTPLGRRYFDLLWRKLGQEGEIPGESIESNVIRNSSNNAVVDAVQVDASNTTVRVHGPASATATWERYEGTDTGYRTLGPYAATSFTGKAYNTTYYVAFNPDNSTYIVTTDYRDTLRNGYFWVGSVLTDASFGGAAGLSGGGGSASGTGGDGTGSGGAGPTGGGGRGGGFGMLL